MQTLKLTKKYETYPEYKDSSVEWLGKIPKNWEPQKLQYLFEIRKRIVGKIGPSVLSITQRGIKVKNIESNDGQLSSDYSKYQIVEKNDFAMNHMDLLTGYVDISQYDGVISPDYRVFSLRNNNYIDRYFLYLFQIGYLLKIFYAYGRGAAQFGRWRLPANEFKSFIFPVPTDDEQKKIVKYLDEKTSSIDQIIEKKQKQIEFLEEKRVSSISAAISDKSKSDWKTEKIKHLVVTIESGIWGENPLGDSNDIKCLRVADFDYSNLSFSTVETVRNNEKLPEKKVLRNGDILMEKSGGGEKTPVGRAILFNSKERMVCANFIDVVRVNKDKVVPDFLLFYLAVLYSRRINTKYIKQNTGIQNMDVKSYFDEPISFPNISIQKKIVEDIQEKMKAFDQAIIHVKSSINLLKELKSSLISRVVTGKVKI
jgi:type I restriction enzyme S subunit